MRYAVRSTEDQMLNALPARKILCERRRDFTAVRIAIDQLLVSSSTAFA